MAQDSVSMANTPSDSAGSTSCQPSAPTRNPDQSLDASLHDLAGKLDSLLVTYAARSATARPASGASGDQPADTTATPPPKATATRSAATPAPQARSAPATVATAAGSRHSDAAADPLFAELKSAKLMIVDDEEVNILSVRRHLQQVGFNNFVYTTDPRDAFAMIRKTAPDLVLLDINMPHVSGLDILRAKNLDRSLHYFPVIILTASTDPAVKHEALHLGAYDFLNKPVDPNELIPRCRNALLVKKHLDQVSDEAARLEELVERRTQELTQSRQQLILSLARAAEHRDNETGNHVIRVGRYAGIIARTLGWSSDQVEMLEQAAQLHDVGKIGIPDAILFKPGKLDPQEYEIIKRHCAMGRDIISPFTEQDCAISRTHARIGANILSAAASPMLHVAARIAQSHHECWDGSGYPLGLAGEDIPLEGRIVAVADVYDALSSRRPYKEPFPREKCFAILEEGRGTRFDPQVLDAFKQSSTEIVEVQLALMDSAPSV
jgi:putative two-component system response regulator